MKTHVFFSPHIDDVMLSCFHHIRVLRDNNNQVIIYNIFTSNSSPPYSKVAAAILQKLSINSSRDYSDLRKENDAKIMINLGIASVYLDYTDAAWRKFPFTNNPLYSTMTSLYQKEHFMDKFILKDLILKISEIRSVHKNAIFYGPLAIGGHVDHVITRSALLSVDPFCCLWEDIPYGNDQESHNTQYTSKRICKSVRVNQKVKKQYLQMYKTEFLGLFPDNKFTIPKEKIWYFNE